MKKIEACDYAGRLTIRYQDTHKEIDSIEEIEEIAKIVNNAEGQQQEIEQQRAQVAQVAELTEPGSVMKASLEKIYGSSLLVAKELGVLTDCVIRNVLKNDIVFSLSTYHKPVDVEALRLAKIAITRQLKINDCDYIKDAVDAIEKAGGANT